MYERSCPDFSLRGAYLDRDASWRWAGGGWRSDDGGGEPAAQVVWCRHCRVVIATAQRYAIGGARHRYNSGTQVHGGVSSARGGSCRYSNGAALNRPGSTLPGGATTAGLCRNYRVGDCNTALLNRPGVTRAAGGGAAEPLAHRRRRGLMTSRCQRLRCKTTRSRRSWNAH